MRTILAHLAVVAVVLGGLLYADLIALTPQGQALLETAEASVRDVIDEASAAIDGGEGATAAE